MTGQERKSSFQYIDKIYENNGIIVTNYKSISKNDVGSAAKIIKMMIAKKNKKKRTN